MPTFRVCTQRRLIALTLLALVAGCHRPPPSPDKDGNRVEQPIAARDEVPRVACATDGGEMTENGCTVETGADGVLTIRNPNGGFHRLQLDIGTHRAPDSRRGGTSDFGGQSAT